MYLNVIINDRVNVKVAPVSIAEMRAIQRTMRYTAQSVVGEGDEQIERIIAEGNTQDTRVITEGDTQYTRIITEGDTQDTRVITEGDTQVARVIAEGDIQADKAELQAWIAEAEAKTAESFANKFFDTTATAPNYVDDYSSNGDGTFIPTPLVGIYSTKWYDERAKANASPLTFIGLWDASGGDGTLPAAGTEDGEYYIVSVAGTVDTTYYGVGDFLIWANVTWNHLEKEEGGGIEAGIVMNYASSAIPSGWLVCDGTEVSQTTFPDLFAAIGSTWDTFGGVSAPIAGNFRLPPQEHNGKPLYIAGAGTNLPGVYIPENVGEHTHTLSADSTFTADVMTEHSHANTATFTGTALPNHSHTQPYNPIGGGGNIHHILGGSSGGYATSAVSAGTPSGSVSVTNLPNDIPLTPTGTVATTINETPITGNNNPESVVMVMCIKAFGVVYNPDSVDIQALEQQVLANEQAIATQDTAIALNTAKVTYKDTMTFDGTTLTITIG